MGLLFHLPPSWLRSKNDVFLPAHRDDRNLWRFIEQDVCHLRLVTFGQRHPLASHDEMRVVPHPLRFLLAHPRRQQFRALLECELTWLT